MWFLSPRPNPLPTFLALRSTSFPTLLVSSKQLDTGVELVSMLGGLGVEQCQPPPSPHVKALLSLSLTEAQEQPLQEQKQLLREQKQGHCEWEKPHEKQRNRIYCNCFLFIFSQHMPHHHPVYSINNNIVDHHSVGSLCSCNIMKGIAIVVPVLVLIALVTWSPSDTPQSVQHSTDASKYWGQFEWTPIAFTDHFHVQAPVLPYLPQQPHPLLMQCWVSH